jgi:hypothetical protein
LHSENARVWIVQLRFWRTSHHLVGHILSLPASTGGEINEAGP